MNQISIKLILVALFVGCLFHMPYGYYQFVRFLGMFGFILLAYFSSQRNQKMAIIIYIALALLFQPFIKLALGRTYWNIVDVIVSAGLIISIFLNPKKV